MCAPTRRVLQWTRSLGLQIMHRVVTLGFTLLTFFFICVNRERLRRDVPYAAQRLFGPTVLPILDGVVHAIGATVDGIVLVAIAEGAIMAGVYAIAGAPHPILLGAITGIFAMIPFAAPIIFGAVALVLGLSGAIGAAIIVLVAGFIVLFAADHFVRPVIIGEGAKTSVPVGTSRYLRWRGAIRTGGTVHRSGTDGRSGFRLAKLGSTHLRKTGCDCTLHGFRQPVPPVMLLLKAEV